MGRTPPGQTRNRVFSLVRERLLAGLPPTVREVQKAFRFRSVQTAREHLEALVKEGRLAKRKGQARGYRLPDGTGFGDPTVLVPLLGRVQAGLLTEAVEDLEGYIPIQSRHSPAELFGLRVCGDSMSGVGILQGDVVIVHRQPSAESGQIVVALVGDEATVKRLRIRGRRIELHPENPDFDVIVPEPEELTVLGKVVEVRRSLEGA
jgi:repressor LexA